MAQPYNGAFEHNFQWCKSGPSASKIGPKKCISGEFAEGSERRHLGIVDNKRKSEAYILTITDWRIYLSSQPDRYAVRPTTPG